MSSKFPQSLEETISTYKNKYLIDLEDENDDGSLTDSTDDTTETIERIVEQRASSSKDIKSTNCDKGEEEYPKDGEDDGDDDYDNDDDDDIDDFETGDDDSGDVVDDEDHLDDGDEGKDKLKSRLPRDLAGLMGQANVSFARGEYNDAIVMCQEVIRLAPKCADPFISLAEHYSENQEEDKAEQLYLIAAYLQPSNTHLWEKVAESATRRREFRLAATCYTKAIRAEKNDDCILYHLRRCNLYEKLGDQKKALKGYENLLSVLGPGDEKFGLELARGLSRIYQNEHKYNECIRTLENAFEKYPAQIKEEDLTQLGKCYNTIGEHLKTIDLLVRYCKVPIMIDNNQPWSLDRFHPTSTCSLQSRLHIDKTYNYNSMSFSNKCVLLTSLISTSYYHDTFEYLLESVVTLKDIPDRESLFETAKALHDHGDYEKAKQILNLLTHHRDNQEASVWLLYSQCLKNLNEIDEAIQAYQTLLTYDPDDYKSRLALSNLMGVQGRYEEALEVTKQPLFSEKPVDIQLLHQSCKLLDQLEKWDDYCKSAKALILADMVFTQHSKEIMIMITSKSLRTRLDNLRTIQKELNIDGSMNRQKSVGTKLDSHAMLKVFLRYLQILFHIQKDLNQLKRICFSAYTSPILECFESSIDYYTAVACVLSNDKEFTYNHLKLLASRNPDKNQTWNLLGMAMSNIYQDMRHGKFCLRQFLKNPEIQPLGIFNGHNALMSGSYKHALGEYMSVFQNEPNNPFIAFSIGLTFLSLSCQRYVSSKYLCLFQMIAFMYTYLELRGTCQESMYNMGRAFHQMNMLDKAAMFYKKALSLPPSLQIIDSSKSKEEIDKIFNLNREIAFNLAMIYKNSRSYELANQVIRDYFTV